ncbi:MAG TPA: hypothetical protein VG056_11120, partial [Pirellulales bacterium]|nr:hypothetical protein [Pirellulales bacterium]
MVVDADFVVATTGWLTDPEADGDAAAAEAGAAFASIPGLPNHLATSGAQNHKATTNEAAKMAAFFRFVAISRRSLYAKRELTESRLSGRIGRAAAHSGPSNIGPMPALPNRKSLNYRQKLPISIHISSFAQFR